MQHKVKKPSRKSLVDKLDTVVSLYIRARDGSCVTCPSKDSPTNGHLFTRQAYSTRWDISPNGNCHQQCAGCNLRHEHDSYPFNNWYITKFGKDAWDELHLRYATPRQFKDWQLIELYESIKQQYETLLLTPQHRRYTLDI